MLGQVYRNSSTSRGIDVFSSANDDVFGSPGYFAVPIFVHSRQIARMQPIVSIEHVLGGLWIIEIALHDHVSTRAEFARCSNRNDLTCQQVYDFDFRMGQRPAH